MLLTVTGAKRATTIKAKKTINRNMLSKVLVAQVITIMNVEIYIYIYIKANWNV